MGSKRMRKAIKEMSAAPGASHPFRDLLLQLPLLTVSSNGAIDYETADPDLLCQIASNGQDVMDIIHLGTWAIGKLLAYAAPEAETRELSGDAIESLGIFVSEISEFAAFSNAIANACRRYTADYAPRRAKKIRNVRI